MTTDQIYSKNSLTRPSSLLYSVLSLKFLTLLFIIDEWLLLKPTESEQHDILELLHQRRKKSSTIFCSQILKEGWYEALGGENTEAEAILDRITYDGYNINIEYTDPGKAVSMRKLYSRLKPID